MITATVQSPGARPLSVPVRVLAWDQATYDVTVQSLRSGHVRCMPLSRLHADGGLAELMATLQRVGGERVRRVGQRMRRRLN